MPRILIHGLDELVVQQTLTPIPKVRFYDYRELWSDALRDANIQPTITYLPPNKREIKLGIQGADISLVPIPGGLQSKAHIKAEALHQAPSETCSLATTALSVLEDMMPESGRLVPGSVALHADVIDFKCGSNTCNRFAAQRRVQPRGNPVTNLESGAGFFRMYDKTEELRRRPRKVYIQDFWDSAGWDGARTVWRIEFTWSRAHLIRESKKEPMDWDDLWDRSLDKVRLTRGRGDRRSRLPDGRLWRCLRALSFPFPWLAARAPSMPIPIPRTHDRRCKDAMGRFRSGLAELAMLDPTLPDTPVTAAMELARRVTRDPEQAMRYKSAKARLAMRTSKSGPC